jgi:hypothetical protein
VILDQRCRHYSAPLSLPETLFSNKVRRMATGELAASVPQLSSHGCRPYATAKATAALVAAVAGADKGGDIQVMEPVQHVLEQSAVQINADGTVVAQIALNFLTARGPKS